MRNHTYKIDENFLKVHPDLAALFREVEKKEQALLNLKAKKKMLKDQLKATKNELAKRLTALETWQQKGNGETTVNTAARKRRMAR